MLTQKQYELLTFIDSRLKSAGVSPSFDEMKDALRLKSKSGIHRLLTGLEERGFIRRLPHRARALEVLRLPENLEESSRAPTPTAFAAQVTLNNFCSTLHGARAAVSVGAVQLPLYCGITTGTSIETLRKTSTLVEVPAGMIGRDDEYYALIVEGDSMVEAGILDGDTVLIRRCERAENGAIVVSLVDGREVTLKRLRRKGASIALEPANGKYETRIFCPDRVKVQGVLVGLLRTY